jgi:hypothetical protein
MRLSGGRKMTIYILFLILCILCGLLYLEQRGKTEGFSDGNIPRIIWTYWHDPQIPPKVKQMLDERRKVLGSWDHRVLNEDTVYDYIPKDEFPQGYDALGHQHKADWIRLYLLKTYAGCWMDASIIVNRADELEELYELSLEQDVGLTGYYLPERLANGNPRSWIENFILLAPIGSSIINKWFDEFTLAIEIGFLPYKKRVFLKKDVSNIFPKEDENTYYTAYASLQYILTDCDRIVIKDASKSVYTYHDECRWDSPCVIKKINNTSKNQQPDIIKLIGQDRTHL